MSFTCAYTKYEPLFGSWHIVKRLGQGSEGELFEISRKDVFGHVSFSAMKAITIPGDREAQKAILSRGIRKEDLESYYKEAVSRNVKEYRMMYKLKGNSHIVSYEDHQVIRHTEDSGWDILIRIEELTPLIDHVLEHPMTPADVCLMGIHICRGLAFCKRFDIIHRDIKPENIFIAPSGDYKLGDFGIAQILEYTHTAYSQKGTYSYMAPEVFRGKGYGATVDIYSLGLVMYKYLNDGRNPFLPPYPEMFTTEQEEMALADRISGEELPPPAHGTARLKEIVLKACSFDPGNRYPTAQAMMDDLEEVMRLGAQDEGEKAGAASSENRTVGGGSREKSPETGRLSARQRSIRRRVAAAAAALILCALAGGILWWRQVPKKVTEIGGLIADTKIYIGEQLAPQYTVEPERFAQEPITFSSSDEKIFTVDQNGRIQAVSVGDATLTMKVKDYTDQVQITVIPKVTSIDHVSSSIKLVKGKNKQLEPVLVPEKFADESISYTSRDPKIARISKEGKMTALKPGRTTVTVSAGGYEKKIRVRVVKPAAKKKTETEETAAEANQNAAAGSGGSSYSGSWSGSNTSKSQSKSTQSSKSKSKSQSGSGNSGKSKSGSSGSNGTNGYFESGDDEYFQ